MPPKKSAGAAPTRVSARQAADTKPEANTKAKVAKPTTKPAATTAKSTAKAAAKAPAKARGRPKATETATKTTTKTAAKTATKVTNGTTTTTTTTTTKKAAAATKDAPKKKAGRPAKKEASEEPEKKPVVSRKRKATEEPEVAPAKKAKVVPKGPVINTVPKQPLNVYVFGEGSSGELGLGTAKNAIDVKRPRLNANLNADSVSVVQIAAGGMHVVALTKDNKILSWGVNDQGALGRDTAWEGGLRDMDAAEDSDSDDDSDAGLNPKESTPTAIPSDRFPEDTVFVQVAAGDSTSFALTDDGQVWGWGTFRSNEGIFGFTQDVLVQREPMLIPGLKKVTSIACGANHTLALDSNGAVFAWGSGQQNQLGRRVVERTKTQGLVPREFGLPKKAIKYIACGDYHSFAIDNKNRVWTWGLNNYGETGIADNAGEDDAVVLRPEVVTSLSEKTITCIQGGGHHSIAVTDNGDCLVWGRIDGHQMGIKISDLPDDATIKDQRGSPRILAVPTKVTAIDGKVAFATAASDHSIAITDDGRAYSWGFSTNYQTGLGTTDDVEVATHIDNTATRGKKLNYATAGSQFSILTSPAEEAAAAPSTEAEAPKTNGVNGTA
ncbi:hypothetical protein AAFC00_006775 [Neodothiora populina]